MIPRRGKLFLAGSSLLFMLSSFGGAAEPPSALASLRAAAVPGGLEIPVAGHGFSVHFTAQGAQISGSNMDWTLTPLGYGRGVYLRAVGATRPRLNTNRVQYDHEQLTEWYANAASGLEQGFTIPQAPKLGTGALTIAMRLPTHCSAEVDENLLGLTLTGPNAQYRYAGLIAKDAAGKALRIWLDLQAGRLLLKVDDTGAHYPVFIDPTIQRAQLYSSDETSGDEFGDAVAVFGSTVVVGAQNIQLRNGELGAAYIFEKPAAGWANMTQTAKLTPSDNALHFGASVAISGDTIVIGAPWTPVNGVMAQGVLYVFVKPAGGWKDMTETAKLLPYHANAGGNSWAGTTVAIDGNTIVSGVPNVSELPALGFGEALVYVMPPGGWKSAYETAVLYTNTYYFPQYGAGFGKSVAISSGTIVVGATGCCVQGVLYEGSAYVFVEPPGGWVTTDGFNAELKGAGVGVNDYFGYSAGISGNTVVIGSPQTYSYQVGAAYVYVEPTTGWTSMTQTAELYPLFYLTGNFGSALAIDGDTILIGAPLTEGPEGRGVVYTFVKPSGGWTSTSAYNAEFKPNSGSTFGQAVGFNGTTAVVGYGPGATTLLGGADVFSFIP
jgi:hypothetical protein